MTFDFSRSIVVNEQAPYHMVNKHPDERDETRQSLPLARYYRLLSTCVLVARQAIPCIRHAQATSMLEDSASRPIW